jgi:SnoaL-like domain
MNPPQTERTPLSAVQHTQLQALLDREAIRDALMCYCRGIDRADEESLRSAYWPDASDCHGAYQGSVQGFIDKALPRLRRGGLRSHIIGNILIELHGSQAAVESSFVALQAPMTSSGVHTETFLCGRYADRFEQREGEWRIAERTVIYDWIEERSRPELNDANALFGSRQPVGAAMPQDAVYALLERVRNWPHTA